MADSNLGHKRGICAFVDQVLCRERGHADVLDAFLPAAREILTEGWIDLVPPKYRGHARSREWGPSRFYESGDLVSGEIPWR